MNKALNKFEILWIVFLFTSSVFFGTLYSIFNLDPHHWGFIAGTALDVINGKKLFTETYIQYGVGQPLFFNLISYFFSVNYSSIGIITSIVYALELVLIFVCSRKVSNSIIAVIISATSLALHTYSIYPWPDYYSGFFIILSCYFILDSQTLIHAVLAGLCLFAAFLFRNTYLISFLFAVFAYCTIAFINKEVRHSYIFKIIFVFIALIVTYLLFLTLQGNLTLWYSQGIGASTEHYGIDIKSILNLLHNAFWPAKIYLPNNLITTSFSTLFYTGMIVVFFSIFKKFNNPIQLFISILGLVGIAQSLKWYQTFRIQNSCVSLYVVFAYFSWITLQKLRPLSRTKILPVLIIIYLFLIYSKFPNATAIYPLFNKPISSYAEIGIPFFKNHRFQRESALYYESLTKLICDGKKGIINRTMDSTLPYLCPDQNNALILPFYYEPFLKNSNIKLNSNMIMISDVPLSPSERSITTLIGELKGPPLVMFGYRGDVKVFKIKIDQKLNE
jgi:hypothetical protein